MTEVRTVEVSSVEAETRLDRWFARHFPDLSHGLVQKLLRTGQVRVDGARASGNLRLSAVNTSESRLWSNRVHSYRVLVQELIVRMRVLFGHEFYMRIMS